MLLLYIETIHLFFGLHLSFKVFGLGCAVVAGFKLVFESLMPSLVGDLIPEANPLLALDLDAAAWVLPCPCAVGDWASLIFEILVADLDPDNTDWAEAFFDTED